MLNLDMVGRLQDEKLIVHGTGTASEFDALVDRLGKEYGFQITKKPGGFGPSDHSSFYAANVPVLFFFTGSHKDYHRPTDDYDKLNIAGMRRVAAMVVDAAVALAEAPARPQYVEVKGASDLGGGGDRPYFGSIPDFAQDEPGYALTGVTKGGPAERAGIKAGDIIVQFGDSKIGNLEDFDSALRKFKAGDKVPVVVKRGGEQVKLEVTLDPPR
jgi:membrane-associated protease RseP (regulator of RpoE activity)